MIHLGTYKLSGVKYYFGSLDITSGAVVTLHRDPENEKDFNAVLVKSAEGNDIGYLPRGVCTVIRHLITGSQIIKATVLELESEHDHVTVNLTMGENDG